MSCTLTLNVYMSLTVVLKLIRLQIARVYITMYVNKTSLHTNELSLDAYLQKVNQLSN